MATTGGRRWTRRWGFRRPAAADLRPAVRRRARGEGGQGTVEFAFVAVLVLMLFFGVVEFTAVAFDQLTLAGAARVGARAGALEGRSASQAVSAATAAAQADASFLVSCPLGATQADDGETQAGQMTVTMRCTYHPLTPLGMLVGRFVGATPDFAVTLSATGMQAVE